jgi:DNA-binding transcriptional MerR regulator
MSIHNDYLKTNEVANLLGVSISTIYKYVKEKKLTPVYQDKWRIDESLLFRPKEVEKLKDEFKKPGLTTGEVATKLNIHPTTVSSYIAKGILPATKKLYKGRELYFIEQEDLDRFQENQRTNKREKKQFYSKTKGFFLFQVLTNERTNEKARIMEFDGQDGKAITEDGRILSLTQLKEEGFTKKQKLVEKKYITKRGFAVIELPKPNYINSPVFSIIEAFYQHLGPQNIKINSEKEYIYIEVKPIFIEGFTEELYQKEISIIEKHLKEGKLEVRHNGIIIDSDLEPLTLHIPSALKQSVVQNSKDQGLTIEEYTTKILQEIVNHEKRTQYL